MPAPVDKRQNPEKPPCPETPNPVDPLPRGLLRAAGAAIVDAMDEHMLHHIDDVRRLVAACALRGLAIGERDAYEAWCSYSETSAAGWLALADDDDLLFDVVRDRIGSPAAPGDFRHTS